MSIKADIIRGHTDTIILAHLIKNNSYGYEINKSIKDKTNNKYELNDATLYCAFRRLEEARIYYILLGRWNNWSKKKILFNY